MLLLLSVNTNTGNRDPEIEQYFQCTEIFDFLLNTIAALRTAAQLEEGVEGMSAALILMYGSSSLGGLDLDTLQSDVSDKEVN